MQKEIPAFVVLLVGLVWTPEISEKRRLKVGSHVFPKSISDAWVLL